MTRMTFQSAMKRFFSGSLIAILLVALVGVGCSRDPEARKQKHLAQGKEYFEQEKFREASIEFLNAIQIDGNFAEAHYQLGQTYLRLGIWTGAYQSLTRAVELNPGNLPAQVDVGKLLLAGRQFQQAQEKAELVLKADPNNVEAHILLANSYAAIEDIPSSLRQMQQAIQLEPERAQSYLSLGLIQLTGQQAAAAESSFKKALEIDPASLRGHLALGGFYQGLRRWEESETMFRRAIALSPKESGPHVALARVLVAQGKSDQAEQVMRDAKQTLRDVPGGPRALGDFYYATGQMDKAVAEYAVLNRESPNDLQTTKNYIQLLILTRDLPTAARLNDALLQKNQRDVDGLSYRGQILLAEGKAAQAIPVLESALKDNADNTIARYYLGRALMDSGNMQRAETEFREVARLRPNWIPVQEGLAAVASRKGDIPAVEQAAEIILRTNPSFANGYVIRGGARMNRGDAAGAERDYQKVIELEPSNSTGYARLGALRLRQKRLREAQVLLEQALTHDSQSAEALQVLFNVYTQLGQPQRGLERIQQQVQKHPANATLHFMLGVAYVDRRDLQSAEASLDRSRELDPRNITTLLTLAQVRQDMGRTDQAAATLEATLREYPRDPRPFVMFGVLEESRKNVARAQELYEKALQNDPENALAANNLAYILLTRGGNVDRALSLAQIARRGLPSLANTADTLGWAYYHKGAYALALAQFNEALKQAPDNPTYHYHIGLTYQKTGDAAKARTHLNRALRLNPTHPDRTDIEKALRELSE